MFISSRSCYGAGGLSASLLMLLGSHAHAAEFTANAGSLLRQNAGLAVPNGGEKPASTDEAVVTETPSSTAAGDVAFPVRDIQIDGELSERERRHVEALVAPLRGQELTMSALQVLRVTMQSHGILSASYKFRVVRMADLRGKVVLIDFWTYTCINCLNHLPTVTRAWSRSACTRRSSPTKSRRRTSRPRPISQAPLGSRAAPAFRRETTSAREALPTRSTSICVMPRPSMWP